MICAPIINGSANPTQMIIKTWDGAHTQVAITVLSTRIMVLAMFNASVETHFVSNAVKNLIDHARVTKLYNGRPKIQTKVKTSLGSWQTLSNVQSARNLLRKIRVAITWHVDFVVMSFVGYVWEIGKSMDRRQEAIISATSTKSSKKEEIPGLIRRNKEFKMLKTSSTNTCSISRDSIIMTRLKSMPEIFDQLSKLRSTFCMILKSIHWKSLNFLRRL